MIKRLMAAVLCLMLVLPGALARGESAAATGGGDVEAFLAALAAEQKDEWMKSILEAGARNVTWEETQASFSMRSFDPGLKALGKYSKAEDQKLWRAQAIANIAAYNLDVKLRFEADGTVSKKEKAAFLKTVKSAAKASRSAYSKDNMGDALKDMLFRVPKTAKTASAADLMAADGDFSAFIQTHSDLFPCESASEWAPLMYAARNWKFAADKGGPHRIQLTWDAVDPTVLLDRALDQVSQSLASVPASQRPSENNLSFLWRSGLAEAALKAKKGRLSSLRMTVDIDQLIAGEVPEPYKAYYAAYTPSVWYGRLVEGYKALPAEASQPMPKTGIISSVQKKGRGVQVKVPESGRYTYVILRDADTGVIQSEAFIEPGKNVTMKVAEGVYIVQYATGSTWYGTEGAFGPLGTYQASDEFIIAKKKWVLVPGREQAGIILHTIDRSELGAIEDKSVQVEGTLKTAVHLKSSYAKNHDVISGENPFTGLAASGQTMTPIVMVLDNAEDAYPHWGVRRADILFQVPNAGAGATKLLALFGDSYPEQAGPVRSGRSSMLPAALMFNAAFAFAGPPAVSGGQVDLMEVMTSLRMNQTHRVYNLLNNSGFSERIHGIGGGGHNLSCHIADIHRNMEAKQVKFEIRPFLFTDEARTDGAAANIVRVLHRGEDPKGASNSASRAVFKYDQEKKAYTRTNSSGVYTDRDTGDVITFANVIVLRTGLSYEHNYIYLTQHMTGSGSAEIFQNGRYIRGAWVRDSIDGRLVLTDDKGEELKLQRGKSFFILTNEVTNVIYSE